MKKIYEILSQEFLISFKRKMRGTGLLLLLLLLVSSALTAQTKSQVKGLVLDEKSEPLIGATVYVKGVKSISTITDINGQFTLNVPSDKQILGISYVGYKSKEVNIAGKKNVTITMSENNTNMGEVVVVGYGQQKKESVTGAITQTSAKVLERTGGVTSLGQALTGNLPGVITTSSSGMPGAEDPKIVIRTLSSWNNSEPLVLVDGVERSMSTIDVASVESISVLKDASATAVYGVKGGNGVILITTKRGTEGKANIQVKSSVTVKAVSKLPAKYDSYDALLLKNQTVERELPLFPTGWNLYTPKELIDKYRYPANSDEWDRFPNVDWASELFKDYTTSYNTSVNVSGGTKTVKYFSAVDLVHEGDLFKNFNNNRGYNSGFGYNRINVRSNLDFELTKTTKFSANLFGSNGVRTLPYGFKDDDAGFWSSAYLTAPDAMRPIYSDGTWGWYAPRNADVPNSAYSLATSGIEKRTTTQLNTDFALKQQLDMITKGLEFKATLSMDNTFKETGRGINDTYNNAQRKWIDPANGAISYETQMDAGTKLDFTEGVRWSTAGGSVDRGATWRKMYYTAQLNYARKFGKHDVTAMGLFSRDKSATGGEFPRYREDWVFRGTYNYASKYFIEINGAYNGSEKFGPANRFAFFPSFSGGWMLTEENFMKNIKFLDMLKLRGSWGRIGDDYGDRFLYTDQWTYGGNTVSGETPANTPYTYYRISSLGNPSIAWETVEKRNFGADYAFFNGLVSGTVDIFSDYRSDILVKGGSRSVPSYFGATAPTANLGAVKSHGYELTLKLNQKFANGLRLWSDLSMTHAVNKIVNKDDPELLPAYQKGAGYSINQTKSYLDHGFISSWDDVYGSTARATNNGNKLAGDYNIIDVNGDGVIDNYDQTPYQYTSTPQNTYNASLGLEWKGFSCFVQFYGVNNVTREVTFPTFRVASDVAYVEGTYWTKTTGGDISLPRWSTTVGPDAAGTRYLYDGSYIRLKNAEVAYTFTGNWVKKVGVNSFKLYLNGDNLFLWTKMPDDRESNFSNGSSAGAYPTVRRFNLGVNITL